MGSRPATLRQELTLQASAEAGEVDWSHQPLRKTADGLLIDPWGQPFTVADEHPRLSVNVRRSLYLLDWLGFDAWPVLNGEGVEIRVETLLQKNGQWVVGYRYKAICVRDGLGGVRAWIKEHNASENGCDDQVPLPLSSVI